MFFARSYDDAKSSFRKAAKFCGARQYSYKLRSREGPYGEQLTADVALLGRPNARRALFIISGTHGIEGYAGSACQIAFLNSEASRSLGDDTKIVIVHGINPFGFAYGRRTNEDNIDVNRNFLNFNRPLPTNEMAREFTEIYLPRGNSLDGFFEAQKRIDEIATREHGYQIFLKAFQPGQYDDPKALFFGGHSPAWSNLTFRQICRQFGSNCDRIAAIDLHTGLGDEGAGELIFIGSGNARQQTICNKVFSEPVSFLGQEGSISENVVGPLLTAIIEETDAAEYITGALEFGTVPLEQVLRSYILENWAYHFLSPEDVNRAAAQRGLRAAFYCEGNSNWENAILQRSHTVFVDAIAYLSRGES